MNCPNIFSDIPADLSQEIIEDLVSAENIKIERIISKGHKSPESGWYDQEENEWVILLQGEARLLFKDGETVSLTAGDYLNIAAHKKHKVEWTTPEKETIWLAIHY
jgi:cupin 2 domain-containing protein